MEPQVNDKSKVDVIVYKIDEHTQLCIYTAIWCGSCRKIKPKVIEIMSKHKILSQEIIEKTLFKTINDLIPFFIVIKLDKKIDSIQTSDEFLFKQFLSKNGINAMILDEDF